MPTTNIIGICPAAARDGCRAVMAAQGLGPENLGRKLTSETGPIDHNTPATHFFMSFQGASIELQNQLLAAGGGDLPPVMPGVVWGEDGVISAADAMAAMAQLAVASYNNLFDPQQQLDAAMASHNPPLREVPEEEV